jgi:hypothetical protein
VSNVGDKWGRYNDKGRECRECHIYKSWDEFHNHNLCPYGKCTTCKDCRKIITKEQWKNKRISKKIFDRAKTRATEKGLDFDIEESDIIIPVYCPVFKTIMFRPSIDRIDNKKGYVKGNIRIISTRANTLKNNAELWELELILEDVRKNQI